MTFLLDERPVAAAEPVRLPTPPQPPRPSPFPVIAAVVPLVAAGAMWAFTGSVMMLWFAALTPAMLIGSVWDRRRGRRRDARDQAAALEQALTDARARVLTRQDGERRARNGVHPDLWGLCADPVNVWRAHPQREGTLTVGRGTLTIPACVEASTQDDERVQALREMSARLDDAPVVIPLDGAICVRGPRNARAAVARALLLQICVVHPPGRWQVLPGADDWQRALPHIAVASGARTLALVDGDGAHDADMVIRHLPTGAMPPGGTTTVIDLGHGLEATMTRGAVSCAVTADAVSVPQAHALAEALRARAAAEAPEEDTTVRFAALDGGTRGTLGVSVGIIPGGGAQEDSWIDVADDGPHAVVVGTTGAGKSELLVTWALALARAYTPDEVMLILADFKGGTAFDGLATLPHVAGVITDLDGDLADRAVSSLSGEVRRREGVLARLGARDVRDPRVRLPRLVVMVDEFPALIAQHQHLEAVFADISARGRALGIHLVLGCQRVAGTVRDATLTNCGLRIALRVADANDSRTVIGDDHAARLSGGAASRGTAYVRRSGDAAARRVRVALSEAADVDAVLARGEEPSTEPAPWLPPLPTVLRREDLSMPEGTADVIALADVPDEARRESVLLGSSGASLAVFGGPGSGKSTAARAAAVTVPGAVVLSADPERAWHQLAQADAAPPTLLVCDDVDVLAGSFPEPWAAEFTARLDAVLMRASRSGTRVVLTAQRATGALGRILASMPRRALLSLPSRTDHVALGGAAGDYRGARPPGRAVLDGREVQFILTPPAEPEASGVQHVPCVFAAPPADVIGWVTRLSPQRVARVLHHTGLTVTDLADVPAGIDVSALVGTVIVADPEHWQRAWQVGEYVRGAGVMVVGAECAADFRVTTGDRRLPPYAAPGHAWLVRAGEVPEVVAAE